MALSKVNPNSLSLSGELSSGNPLVTIDSTGTSSNEGHALKVIASGRGSGINDVSILSVHNANGELLRVQNAGGISFNGDTAAANALDDYEEGTWTPTLPSAWATGITTYDAHYTKIGNLVHITMWVAVSGITGTFTANIGGLPFTAHGGYGNLGTALVYSGASTAITRTYLSQNSTAFNLLNNSANFSSASNTQVGASNIMANFTYRV